MFIYSYDEETYYNSNEIVAVRSKKEAHGIQIEAIVKGYCSPVPFLWICISNDTPEEEKKKLETRAEKAMNGLISMLNGDQDGYVGEDY